MKHEPIDVGRVYEVPYPFVREVTDDGGWDPLEVERWKPGTRIDGLGDTCDASADGMGAQLLAVVSLHRPSSYPERVFYVRRWRDPDGGVFGKRLLRVTTAGHFRGMLRGYRHRFDLTKPRVAPMDAEVRR